MTYFKFNLLSSRRYIAPGAPTDDVSALLLALEESPGVDTVAILEQCARPAILMVGSETLAVAEVEKLMATKFEETGRELTDYVESEPETGMPWLR